MHFHWDKMRSTCSADCRSHCSSGFAGFILFSISVLVCAIEFDSDLLSRPLSYGQEFKKFVDLRSAVQVDLVFSQSPLLLKFVSLVMTWTRITHLAQLTAGP